MSKPVIFDADRCPDVETHTPCPSGYIAWHSWSKRMGKTHKQTRCPTCGLWTIWIPKPEPPTGQTS